MLTPFLIFTLVGLVSGLDKLGASCELCMQTYKINCTICYDKCVAQKTLKNCTFNQCTSSDLNGNCLIRTSTTLNSNNCLGTCCGSTFGPNTPFTQPNFNLCIERDAYQDENVNIGLTLGLILALLGLLFFAGLVCLLFIMFWAEKEPPTASHRVPTGEHINTLEYQKNSDENTDEEWMSDGYILNGMCQICSSGISNVTAHCGHCYHYSCLSRNLNVSGQQRCPLCEQPQSLKSTKIFCSSCKKQHKILRSDKDRFDIRLASNMQKLKCPNCH